tara:strand:- start:432 stop:926 length:495 start_codon:yes stop_codon:yes gene_type:complete
MKKIAIISDSHGFLDQKIINHVKKCDELWHAGDIGNIYILDYLEKIINTKAVYGNIDDQKIRKLCPENLFFNCEGINVLMTHIAGRPGKYTQRVKKIIQKYKPNLFICGHSHILLVKKDLEYNHLHINPGAIGKEGFHKYRTMIIADINDKQIQNLNVVQFKKN